MKKCSKCGVKKGFDNFYYIKNRDWYSAACKDCHSKREKKCVICNEKFIGSSNQILCGDRCRKQYRPQTYLRCKTCNKQFLTDRLNREYCSKPCWYKNVPKRVNHTWEYKKHALRCARQTRYLISKGKLTRPGICEDCGTDEKYIEAAHYNYNEPERVRWLCRSCHVKWDQKQPKGGCEKKIVS